RDAWREFAGPVEIGDRLLVVPAWQARPRSSGSRAVVTLDPGRAFGSGAHPSTVLALELLAELLRHGDEVLDVGCGGGVVAVAAAVLGARQAYGVDVDPAAVAATAANALANQVADRVEVALDGTGGPEGRFDVVVANVLLPVQR